MSANSLVNRSWVWTHELVKFFSYDIFYNLSFNFGVVKIAAIILLRFVYLIFIMSRLKVGEIKAEVNCDSENFFRVNFMQESSRPTSLPGFSCCFDCQINSQCFSFMSNRFSAINDDLSVSLSLDLSTSLSHFHLAFYILSLSLSLSFSLVGSKGIFQQMRSPMKSELPSQTEPFKVKCNKRMKWINAEEVFSTEKLLFRKKERGGEGDERRGEERRKKGGK